jgi:hypothetical protein
MRCSYDIVFVQDGSSAKVGCATCWNSPSQRHNVGISSFRCFGTSYNVGWNRQWYSETEIRFLCKSKIKNKWENRQWDDLSAGIRIAYSKRMRKVEKAHNGLNLISLVRNSMQ